VLRSSLYRLNYSCSEDCIKVLLITLRRESWLLGRSRMRTVNFYEICQRRNTFAPAEVKGILVRGRDLKVRVVNVFIKKPVSLFHWFFTATQNTQRRSLYTVVCEGFRSDIRVCENYLRICGLFHYAVSISGYITSNGKKWWMNEKFWEELFAFIHWYDMDCIKKMRPTMLLLLRVHSLLTVAYQG
jgi:hypothetical protein